MEAILAQFRAGEPSAAEQARAAAAKDPALLQRVAANLDADDRPTESGAVRVRDARRGALEFLGNGGLSKSSKAV